MSTCENCGATITLATGQPTVCDYCGASNAPPPKEVLVPVPVQLVQNVVHVSGASGASGATAQELRCPHCKKRLVTVRVLDVDLSGCARCGGIWIDNASARRVLTSPDDLFAELASRAGRNARQPAARIARPTCASCPAVLDTVRTHGVLLDVCSEHGTWFDAFELQRLVEALQDPASVAASPSAPPENIRCTRCGGVIATTSANVTDEGLSCEACWRARSDEIRDAGERKAYAEGSVTVGGALLGVAAVMLGAMAAGSSDRS